MKHLKKILRLSGLVMLIVLASVGIGITGAAPVLSKNKETFPVEIKIELVEAREDDENTISENDIK